MSLYERLSSTEQGRRSLASAELRRAALGLLHEALNKSGLNQTELAERLGVRKSAVNQTLRGDGNLRLSTLAEYCAAMGYEVHIALVPPGTRRAERQARARTPWEPMTSSRQEWPSGHPAGKGIGAETWSRIPREPEE